MARGRQLHSPRTSRAQAPSLPGREQGACTADAHLSRPEHHSCGPVSMGTLGTTPSRASPRTGHLWDPDLVLSPAEVPTGGTGAEAARRAAKEAGEGGKEVEKANSVPGPPGAGWGCQTQFLQLQHHIPVKDTAYKLLIFKNVQ